MPKSLATLAALAAAMIPLPVSSTAAAVLSLAAASVLPGRGAGLPWRIVTMAMPVAVLILGGSAADTQA